MKRHTFSTLGVALLLSISVTLRAQNITLGSGNYLMLHSSTDENWKFGKDNINHNISLIGYGDGARKFRIVHGPTSSEHFSVNLLTGNTGIGVNAPNQKLEVNGGILQNSENAAFAVDATTNARLGIIKKLGFNPMIVSDNISPLIFGQTNQTGVHTNISGATLTERMRIEANGYVKIGGGTPRGKFDVDGLGDIYLVDDVNAGSPQSIFLPGHIYIAPHNGQDISFLQARRFNDTGSTSLRIRTYNNGALTDAMHIEADGDVGIGTTHPDAKLTVKGDIHTREVRVDMNGPLVPPDYVFEKDYNLLPLAEVEAYINANKHLPEVPSAKEMEANGLNLKEMNLLLLKKVEELTLHLIEQQKELSNQKLEIEYLKKKAEK